MLSSSAPAKPARAFENLTRESLQTLLLIYAIIIWTWTVGTVFFDSAHTAAAYGVLATYLITGWTSFRLRRRHLNWAVGVYLIGLAAMVTIVVIAFPDPGMMVLYVQIILVSAMLTTPNMTWGIAASAVGMVLLVGARVHAAGVWDLSVPIFLILLTALTGWLSTRQLFNALAWTLAMSAEAQEKAEEARQHRSELQRILQTLDLAYVRLERTNQALIFAQEAAEKAYRFKSEFVAQVSHELRTPLNLIIGFSEMMALAPESYGDVLLPREYRGDIMAIYRSARHLRDLISDVLDLSQIEAGRLPVARQAVVLADVVREASELVRGLAEARGLQLELDLVDGQLQLHLDHTRIRQVLLNLLTNAMRFTDAGWVRVQVSKTQQEVEVTVADSGRGIGADKLASAFEAFSQLDEKLAKGGSGLGLAVSKKFVELHGGRMWIESAEGSGTSVKFTLPLPEQVPLSHVHLSRPIEHQRAHPVVLVLHDNPDILPLLRRHIDGCELVLAETPQVAVERLQAEHPRAILLDPGWAQHWAVGAQWESLAHLPVIYCPFPDERRWGLRLGADDFLSKPVSREDLARAFARLPHPPRSVLIVDDNIQVVRLLARMLRANDPGLTVLEAFGGEEGLEIARRTQPDVVLLDLIMPEVSGYEFLAKVREDETTAQIQMILVSVRSVEQEATLIPGEVRLQYGPGFSLTELLGVVQAMLATVTRPELVSPTSAAPRLAVQPGRPA